MSPRTNRPPDHLPPRPRTVWLLATSFWVTVAVLATTQQWAQLKGTVKEIGWWDAFSWQGISWLLLVPATPALYALVRRFPVGRAHPARLVGHALGAVAFGIVFLLVSVPARLAFHPSPVRWALFGEVMYKSVLPYAGAGALAYGLVVLVASVLETRSRLYATLEVLEHDAHGAPTLPTPIRQPPTPQTRTRIVLTTPIGEAHVPIHEAEWIEPAPSGAVLHTTDGPLLVRHRLSELEAMLAPHGFVRIHRRHLINGHCVREVVGAPSRDGAVRLHSGHALPVTRRRRGDLDRTLSALATSPASASFQDEGVPLSL